MLDIFLRHIAYQSCSMIINMRRLLNRILKFGFNPALSLGLCPQVRSYQ